MPIIRNTASATVRKANSALALAMFPRAMKLKYAKVCGSTRSTSQVEPFTLDGSAPLLQRWNGTVNARGLKSWSLNVPNSIFKNYENIDRSQVEYDQTRTFVGRLSQHGARIAQYPDFLLAKRMIQGGTANSQNLDFQGTSYTTTFDGRPVYDTAHASPSSSNQSNIVQGYHPQTVAGVLAQDVAETANQLQNSVTALINQISTTLDDQGVPILPEFDPEEHLTLFVPPILKPASHLAFKTVGTIGGSNGSSSGATTSIGPMMVKNVENWSLLAGVPDTEADTATTVSPTYATQFYACVDDPNGIKPWYFQKFTPPTADDVVGGDVSAEAKRLARAAVEGGMSPQVALDVADLYASMEVDHNFGALGANAQVDTVVKELFFISCRARGQVFAGPWFLNWLVQPSLST